MSETYGEMNMPVPLKDKNWFSPAKLKVAVSNGHGIPIVKIPGSGEIVNGAAASKVCGVSLTSNRLEDRLQSEVMGCFQMIDNSPTSGFEVVALSHRLCDQADRDPFLSVQWGTTSKVLVKDPRGFVVGISQRCYKSEYVDVNPGECLPGDLVYAWPASKSDIDDGPWLVPASSSLAKSARQLSDAVDQKDAFMKVSDMQTLGVYTAAQGTWNGRKMVFLGCVPYSSVHDQVKAAVKSAMDCKPLKQAKRKALFACLLGDGYASTIAVNEDAASRLFLKSEPGQIPADSVSEVMRIVKREAKSAKTNPVDVNFAAAVDTVWQPFNVDGFLDSVRWIYDGMTGVRHSTAVLCGRATKLHGMPYIMLSWKRSHTDVTLSVYEVTYQRTDGGDLIFFDRQLKSSRTLTLFSPYGMSELRTLAETAAAELGLEQPDLGTKRPPHIVQIGWWLSFKIFRDNHVDTHSVRRVACLGGDYCESVICCHKL